MSYFGSYSRNNAHVLILRRWKWLGIEKWKFVHGSKYYKMEQLLYYTLVPGEVALERVQSSLRMSFGRHKNPSSDFEMIINIEHLHRRTFTQNIIDRWHFFANITWMLAHLRISKNDKLIALFFLKKMFFVFDSVMISYLWNTALIIFTQLGTIPLIFQYLTLTYLIHSFSFFSATFIFFFSANKWNIFFFMNLFAPKKKQPGVS